MPKDAVSTRIKTSTIRKLDRNKTMEIVETWLMLIHSPNIVGITKNNIKIEAYDEMEYTEWIYPNHNVDIFDFELNDKEMKLIGL